MQKMFTRFVALGFAAALTVSNVHAQTITRIWPLNAADSAVSQFADTTRIFLSTTAAPNPAAGFTGWVSKPIACADPSKLDSAQWLWRRDASASGGAYWGTLGPVVSESPTNGAAVFNSDMYDTRGVAGAFGSGRAPAPQEAELISPVINAAGYTDITVQFNQFYRNFDSECFLSYSTDGGTTWSPRVAFNAEIAPNASSANTSAAASTKRVTLFGSVGSPNFRVKFIWSGDFYFWIVDDVKLVDYKVRDLQINTNFVAIPPSLYTPREQMENIYFLADISNVGTRAQANAKLEVKVFDPAGALKYSAVTTPGQYPASFAAATTVENTIVPGSFPSTGLPLGRYTGYYRVFGDSTDNIPANDTFKFSFWVTDTAAARSVVVTNVGRSNYTKENAAIVMTRNANSNWTATEPHSWRIGNYYRIKLGAQSQGRGTITSIVTLLNAKAAANTPLQASLYKWVDANADGVVNASERTLVALGDTLVPATSTGNTWFRFPIRDNNTGGDFTPENNTDYIAVIEWNAPQSTVGCLADSCYLTAGFSSGLYNYGAMRFVTDSMQAPRYTIIIGKTLTSDWSTAGFTNQTLSPVVRLNVLSFNINNKEILDGSYKVVVAPNPVTGDHAMVNIEMPKQQDVAIRVYSMDGRIIAEQVQDNMSQNQQVMIDISNYTSGTYMVQLLTAEGVVTKRFVVSK